MKTDITIGDGVKYIYFERSGVKRVQWRELQKITIGEDDSPRGRNKLNGVSPPQGTNMKEE